MRIAEVRNMIEKYSDRQLRIIIAEMYKAIPKVVKQDQDIDSILANPDEFAKQKGGKKKKQVQDIETLRMETEKFPKSSCIFF